MILTGAVIEKFWSRVERRGADDCWPWLASTDNFGRGKFWVVGSGRHYPAPRVALMLTTGESPPSTMFACHSCDNPACCNPAHLWWGDRSANMADCGAKGRHGFQQQYRGANNPQSKLDNAAVRDIRRRYAEGERPAVLAAEYEIHPASVWKIATKRSWQHVE